MTCAIWWFVAASVMILGLVFSVRIVRANDEG